MSLVDLFRRAEPEEIEEEEDEVADWERQVGAVHERPLLWSLDPPTATAPRWFYVRRPGQVEYEPIKVEPGFEYPSGFEYAGPLPTPYEVKTVRR